MPLGRSTYLLSSTCCVQSVLHSVTVFHVSAVTKSNSSPSWSPIRSDYNSDSPAKFLVAAVGSGITFLKSGYSEKAPGRSHCVIKQAKASQLFTASQIFRT